MKNWFTTWFNTPYYHLLYKDRNLQEAEHFLSKLLLELSPKINSRFLDIACGKGRHALFIHQKGFESTGVDLSKESILYAQQYKKEGLNFEVHDMRLAYKENQFDYVLNLFTSIGYFEHSEENQEAITNMANNLVKGGKLIIDFMNAKKVMSNIVASETKTVEHLTFQIERKIVDGYIIKNIRFSDQGQDFHYQERVQALTLSDFSDYLQKAGLKILNLWGDYNLNDFDAVQSDRLIIVAQK